MKKNYSLILLLTLLTTSLWAQEDRPYRPFVEDGKVWTIGWFSKTTIELEQLEYYYFDGDTLINHQPCKRMMSRMSDEKVPTYQGAYYEKNRRVYCCFPGNEDFVLLYDFGAEEGEAIKVYSPCVSDTVACVVTKKEIQYKDSCFKGTGIVVSDKSWNEKPSFYVLWMEGVGAGTIPFYNILYQYPSDYFSYLMSCTVGDEVLSHNAWYMDFLAPVGGEIPDVPSRPDNSNPKRPKQKIDFTHVVKKQPKREGEIVAGSFDSNRLMINLQDVFDLYAVTVTDSLGQVVYTKQVLTDNVLALNIDVSDLPYSDYTITIENDEYIFTGRFLCSPPYDYDGDRILTLNDITTLINIYLTDEDGLVTVSDVTALLEIYLNNEKE